MSAPAPRARKFRSKPHRQVVATSTSATCAECGWESDPAAGSCGNCDLMSGHLLGVQLTVPASVTDELLDNVLAQTVCAKAMALPKSACAFCGRDAKQGASCRSVMHWALPQGSSCAYVLCGARCDTLFAVRRIMYLSKDAGKAEPAAAGGDEEMKGDDDDDNDDTLEPPLAKRALVSE